jgi:hypothetical protein
MLLSLFEKKRPLSASLPGEPACRFEGRLEEPPPGPAFRLGKADTREVPIPRWFTTNP